MSDSNTGHPQGEDVPPNHLGTSVPSGGLDNNGAGAEKAAQQPPAGSSDEKKPVPEDDDEEEEDMDALIEELESQDHHGFEEEDEVAEPGGARPVPEELLQTDTRTGLTDSEVTSRRKKYGLNQMKEEKENLFLKFLSYFVGPIQFVMEVSACSLNSFVS